MSNAVQKAIDAAKAKAAENASNAVVAQQPQTTGTSVGNYTAGKKFTLDDMGSGGLSVDHFIKVTESGLNIKDKPGLIEELIVSIDLSNGGIQPCQCAKYGNPAVYIKTYDGVSAAQGGSWEAALATATRNSGGVEVRPYWSADLTMILEEDALTYVKTEAKVVLAKGAKLGHSTSTTNKKNLDKLKDEIKAQDLDGKVILVKLGYEPATNKAGNVWGIITFELLGEKAPE